MPALTRRRNLEAAEECWHVYYGDVRVGTIAIRERRGIPPSLDRARLAREPSKLKLLSIFLLVVFAGTTPAMSADQVMIAGIGSKSCAYWTSRPAQSEGEKWALGFCSGLNYVAAVTKDQNQLIIDPDRMLSEIAKMCAERPTQSLADSVWITFLTLNKSQ